MLQASSTTTTTLRTTTTAAATTTTTTPPPPPLVANFYGELAQFSPVFKKSHIGLLNFIQDFQDAACAAVTLQVYLFCKNYSWEFKITLRSTFHIKVHSGCLEHLAPTDGTPGIGDGCQIKLAFKAAGDVNWRLGIQVLDPIFSAVPRSRCSKRS